MNWYLLWLTILGLVISLRAPQTLFPHETLGSSDEKLPFDWSPPWREAGDCGPIAVCFLARMTGVEVDLSQVKDRIGVDPERGSSLFELQECLNQLGVAAQAKWVPPDKLRKLPFPYILHISPASVRENELRGHFLVALSYDAHRDTFTMFDTNFCKLAEFNARQVRNLASGYVLTDDSLTPVEASAGFVLGAFVGGILTLLASRWPTRLSVQASSKAASV